MRKYILLVLATTFISLQAGAQSRGVKIGYIDMEYILEKVPDYAEAKNQLEAKAQKWKQEIEEKKIEINKLKEVLKTEKVLLTKELIEEREEEISFLETELLDYQQKRFGPNGDLVVQKAVLVKPIQDQVFNTVQDIAEAKKYDYIFDKSSDLTMLFAAKRYDISDKVVQMLTRAEKREQMNKKQLKEEAERERKQDMIDDNPNLSERQKILEERKLAREKMMEDRKTAAEEKKKAFEDKRKQLLEDREAKKNGTVSDKDKDVKKDADKTTPATDKKEGETSKELTPEEKLQKATEAKSKTLEERQKLIDERKKATEEKRQKILADREAARKAKEEENKKKKEESKP